MPIIRGILGPHTFGDVPYHTHEFDEISGKLTVTEADITSLSASKITTGEITASTITLGAGGVIKSSDFVTGPGGSGFQISTGLAEFNNVTVRGALISGTGSSVDWTYLTNISVTNADIVSLDAGKINAGTLDSGVINTGALNADNITTGTLSADFISGGTISADLISGGTLSGDLIFGGTINATNVNVTNINGTNITTNTIPGDALNVSSLSAINGNSGSITVNGWLTTTTGGGFRTGTAGSSHVEIDDNEAAFARFYSTTKQVGYIGYDSSYVAYTIRGVDNVELRADDNLALYGGTDLALSSGGDISMYTTLDMYFGDLTTDLIRSSATSHQWLSGANTIASMFHDGSNGWISTDVLAVSNELQLTGNGSASDPSLQLGSTSNANGWYMVTTNSPGMTGGGALRFWWDNANGRIDFNGTVVNNVNELSLSYGSATDVSLYYGTDNNTGFYHIAENYHATSVAGQIVQQWGWSGSNLEVYLYGLQNNASSAVHWNSSTKLLSYSTSTRRIKKNERPLEVGLTDLFKPKRFQYRRNDEITAKDHSVAEGTEEQEAIGFIAEDVGKALPEAGTWDGEHKQPVNYDERAVLAAVVADLQDARKRIAKLEDLLAAA